VGLSGHRLDSSRRAVPLNRKHAAKATMRGRYLIALTLVVVMAPAILVAVPFVSMGEVSACGFLCTGTCFCPFNGGTPLHLFGSVTYALTGFGVVLGLGPSGPVLVFR
jgi:hypothetical protein